MVKKQIRCKRLKLTIKFYTIVLLMMIQCPSYADNNQQIEQIDVIMILSYDRSRIVYNGIPIFQSIVQSNVEKHIVFHVESLSDPSFHSPEMLIRFSEYLRIKYFKYILCKYVILMQDGN